MTLRQWSEAVGIDVRQHKSGAWWVPDSFVEGDARWSLFHLDDCAVSSVTGGTLWLVQLDERARLIREAENLARVGAL